MFPALIACNVVLRRLRILSRKRVASCSGAVLKAANVSGLIPVLMCVRYESLLANVKLPMETNTKSVRCSIAFATTQVMLALKSMRYCNSSVAVATLEALFPLPSVRITLLNLKQTSGADFTKGLSPVSESNLRLLSQIIGIFYLSPWAQP